MSKRPFRTSIFIFRRDFRLTDNIGLIKALEQSNIVIPIFIFTTEQILKNEYKSNKCVQFMVKSLRELNEELNKKGSKLNFFYGDVIKNLSNIIKNNDADAIFVNADYTPYSKERDKNIEVLAKKMGCEFKSYEDILLNPIGTILNGQGDIFVKFTPYFNKAKNIKIDVPSKNSYSNYAKKIIRHKNEEFKKIYDENKDYLAPGRSSGLQILRNIKKFSKYNNERNVLSVSTTNLSAYIKFGLVSIREVYYTFKNNLGNTNDLIKQLYWRDFYYNIADKYPHVFSSKGALKPIYNKIKWNNSKVFIDRWCSGTTGFPIIDAAMTEMNTTGFMHNRARLIVASFLVKILLVNWKVGEKYFAQKLVDYDPCVNNGNWQWVAGSGADAQPYFRIFNPWAQSKKHDPECIYIKKWLPILKKVDTKHIHEWNIYNTEYDIDYPKPIVEYSEYKERALVAYKQIYKK